MMLHDTFHYIDDVLHVDLIPLPQILANVGTPIYIYSLRRALGNLARIRAAFGALDAHVHYSAKANANLMLLQALIEAGAGVDAVSAGEIYRALKAGADPDHIVFAGVGKTPDELAYAVTQGVGWFNIENVAECALLNEIAGQLGQVARVALRLNPEVTANTHPYIATGHGGAKFGLTAQIVRDLLARRDSYPYLQFAGIHVHIGSQLHDVEATVAAVRMALDLIAPYPDIRTVNIGGGLPVAYQPDEVIPPFEDFAAALRPLLEGYTVLLEPGRSIIADAGIFVATTLYVKQQAAQSFLITDGSMAELIRPALYGAAHEVVPVIRDSAAAPRVYQVVGPVCETADVLARDVSLPPLGPGDPLALLNAGAYGMVMSSNYNQRPRPPEIVVMPDGMTWRVARRRETWDDLLRIETL